MNLVHKENPSDFLSEIESIINKDFFWNYKTDDILLSVNSNNEVMGFSCFDINSDRDDIPYNDNFIYFSLIIIDYEYRGQGIGQKMIEEIIGISEYEGLPVVFGTWESNEKQIHIAQKYNFELYEIKENHRYNGENTLYFCYEPE